MKFTHNKFMAMKPMTLKLMKTRKKRTHDEEMSDSFLNMADVWLTKGTFTVGRIVCAKATGFPSISPYSEWLLKKKFGEVGMDGKIYLTERGFNYVILHKV